MTDECRNSGVLVVIPTLNEAGNISQVLQDLSIDLPTAFHVAFVVADGGSVDKTVEIVKKICATRNDVYLIKNPNRLQGAAVNLAVKQFAHDFNILVRCDAHMFYPPGFIRQLTETLVRVRADAVVVPMDSVGNTCLQKAIAWISDTVVGSGGSAHRGGKKSGFVDHGHHAAFLVSSFLKAGGYDESFSHNEDAELDYRQKAHGGKIYLDANIRVIYHPRSDFLKLGRQYFNYGCGRARTIMRHPSSLRIRQFVVPSYFSLMCIALVTAPFVPVLLLIPALYCAILIIASLVISVQKHSLCGLFAGPAAFVMHACWAAGFLFKLLPAGARFCSTPVRWVSQRARRI